VVGDAIRDTATLAGGFHPTGTISFALYSDPGTCHVAVFSDTETLDPNGSATSKPYLTAAAGAYQWVATYSGDVNNNAVAGSCSDTAERITVGPAGSGPGGPGGHGGYGGHGGHGGYDGPGSGGVWWFDPCPCPYEHNHHPHHHHHWGHHRHHRHTHWWWKHHRHHPHPGRWSGDDTAWPRTFGPAATGVVRDAGA
jgi:hypothetical protein